MDKSALYLFSCDDKSTNKSNAYLQLFEILPWFSYLNKYSLVQAALHSLLTADVQQTQKRGRDANTKIISPHSAVLVAKANAHWAEKFQNLNLRTQNGFVIWDGKFFLPLA